MESGKLIPYAELVNQSLTILEIAERVVKFYRCLYEFDSRFGEIYIMSEKKSIYLSINIGAINAVQMLSDEILNQNLEDIVKIDKVKNPDVNYIRKDNHIHFSICVEKNKEETLLTLFFSFIQSEHVRSKIGTITTHKCLFDSYSKCISFLSSLNQSFEVDYAVIKVTEAGEFNNDVRKYRAPLGWITYFSNHSSYQIPNDLEGIEYEHSDQGKYLVLMRENFTEDEEKFRSAKFKLIEVMRNIESKIPRYLKNNTYPLT